MMYLASIPSSWYVVLSVALFCIGVLGVLLRRNVMIVLMSIEVMLNAVTLLLVAFSGYHQDLSAQVGVFFIMIVAAAELAVGLTIMSVMYQQHGNIDSDDWSELKG